MIPEGQYSQERLDKLSRMLVVQLRNAQSARAPLEQKWLQYERAYRQEPEFAKKDFPYENCSNLVVPLIPTDTDKVYSWIMAMLFGQSNLWSVKAWRSDWIEFAAKAEEFMEWAQTNELNIYNEISDWVKQLCLLGTSVLKTRYHREVQKVYEFREEQMQDDTHGGTFERNTTIIMYDSPKVEHVNIWDFYIDPSAVSIETAEWCAHHVPITWQVYKQRVRDGVYAENARVSEGWATSRGHMIKQFQQETVGYEPFQGVHLENYEFWVKYDIDGDGVDEALVVTIHVPSGVVLRVDFNPFFNQLPPFDICRFVRVPKMLYGVGVGEMLYYGQAEVTTMHNQRIDAITVRNMPVFWALKGGSVKQDTPIFPGVKLMVDSPNQIGAIPLAAGPFVSTANDEQMVMQIMRERVGVNDFVMGGDGPDVSYASATTALNQVKEGKKRFDQTNREIRHALSSVGTKVLELYQQFNQRGKAYVALGGTDGAIMQKVLNFPLNIIRAGIIVDVAATSAALNKEVEVRTNTLLMQMLSQHGQQQLNLMMQLVNPQIPEPVKQLILTQLRAGSIMMKRVLESYDVQDAGDLITDFAGANGGASGQQSNGPAAGGVQGDAGFGGMGAGPQGFAGQAPDASAGSQGQFGPQ